MLAHAGFGPSEFSIDGLIGRICRGYPVALAARSITRVTDTGSEISRRWPQSKYEMSAPHARPWLVRRPAG
jgi:hypothetical protein